MAEEKLRITITADNKDALAKFQQTIAGLDGVSASSVKAGGATGKLGKDFTGMSRVIQDLPFGFTAISNNLTQLVPAAGAAGLAFSALIAGLTFAQVGLDYWTRGTKAVDEGMIAATKSIAEFSVNVKNVKNDILAAREGVISKEEALKRYNETLGKSTGYANSLDEAEKLMAANTNIVVQSLNLRARAQVMYQNAAQSSAKLVTGEVYKLGFDMETFMDAIKAGFTGKNAFDIVADRAIEAATNTELLTKEGDKLIKQAIDLEKALKKGTGDPTGNGKVGDTEESKEKKALAEMIKAREAYFAEIDRMAADAEMKKDQRRMREMKGEFNTIMPEKSNAQQKDLTNLKLTMDGNTALNQIKQQQIAIDDQLNARTELATKLTDRAMQGLAGVANAMANGGNIGEAFGNMFKQLAIDIALAAAKAAIFQAILSAINPVGGASKAGGFLKGFGKLLGFAQGGTVSGPQSGYPVMLHGTEHIVRPDQMKSIIASAAQMGGGGASRVVVEGRIRGNDIFLSQQRTGTFRNLTT
jgi:hypothetical protein